MIQAEKHLHIQPVAGLNPIADTAIVENGTLYITVSADDEHYSLFESLLRSLQVEVTEKVIAEETKEK
jgi:hypothetical protein